MISVYWTSKLNLKLNFETTQSFKPKNKKVRETVQAAWREPYLFSFFTFRSHQKEKLQYREQNLCVQQISSAAIFVLQKITMTIF